MEAENVDFLPQSRLQILCIPNSTRFPVGGSFSADLPAQIRHFRIFRTRGAALEIMTGG